MIKNPCFRINHIPKRKRGLIGQVFRPQEATLFILGKEGSVVARRGTFSWKVVSKYSRKIGHSVSFPNIKERRDKKRTSQTTIGVGYPQVPAGGFSMTRHGPMWIT